LATPVNLVTNGDFSAGNTGFTSEYASASSNIWAGDYNVRANSEGWNPWFIDAPDHTGDGSAMLVVNGAEEGEARFVWRSTFAVLANTNYSFAAFAMNVCCIESYTDPGPDSMASLRFYANGDLLATINVGGPGVWVSGNGTWNSGIANSVTLELRDANGVPNGNDFAVDDISFAEVTADLQAVEPLAAPEPATGTMLALGLAAAWARRRKSRA